MNLLVLEIILKGMELFTEERRKHFSTEYLELEQDIKDASNDRAPTYSDAKKALAIEKRDTFLLAYHTEFFAAVDKVKQAAPNA